jgi:hypothetical protein
MTQAPFFSLKRWKAHKIVPGKKKKGNRKVPLGPFRSYSSWLGRTSAFEALLSIKIAFNSLLLS